MKWESGHEYYEEYSLEIADKMFDEEAMLSKFTIPRLDEGPEQSPIIMVTDNKIKFIRVVRVQ